ncbi:DUF5694 domain-containing protein [Rheinheimera baltica]|uniref:DUF5694 domain-containing protein n=1 Tax=Rheinheimera baltica TaxID=67576 RepID=UPI00273ECB0C|nr:DUF5694 domain-containing protein [Rheinheimera baltica]MDP5189251.1 DUF5694 domain-containing protein [Rheinheimera baltica]
MKKLSALVFLATSLLIGAQTVRAEEPAQIMLLGTFHFTNPGLDTVKTSVLDVTSADSQQYLQAFSQKLAQDFAPTDVLLECAVGFQGKLNEQYQQYLKGEFTLPVNEIYQLGFRAAKAAGGSAVRCFDEQEIQWNAEPLFEQMPAKAPAIQAAFDALIADVTAQSNDMHRTLSLADLLRAMNSEQQYRLNKSIYLLSNEVGAGDGFVGADAAASWWHRNFRMYANIQLAASPGKRVLVIAGQGHIAVINDFLVSDTQRKAVFVDSFF